MVKRCSDYIIVIGSEDCKHITGWSMVDDEMFNG